MAQCNKCQTEITLNYCPNCGQALKVKKLDRHYFQHEVMHLLHVDKGIFSTTKKLLLHPGVTIKNFIDNDRNSIVKPIIYLIFMSILYSVLSNTLHVNDHLAEKIQKKNHAFGTVMLWTENYVGYTNIILCLVTSLVAKLFYRKSN